MDITIPQTTAETETVMQRVEETAPETTITDTDWSGYFDGLNGAAVIYDPGKNHYQIYNEPVANTRRSPCSTFKIISSLTGLENGMGKAHGVVVDAWFTGFADMDGRRIYFCVYLGETPEANVSSTKAKEIAANIILQ